MDETKMPEKAAEITVVDEYVPTEYIAGGDSAYSILDEARSYLVSRLLMGKQPCSQQDVYMVGTITMAMMDIKLHCTILQQHEKYPVDGPFLKSVADYILKRFYHQAGYETVYDTGIPAWVIMKKPPKRRSHGHR